MSNTLLLALSTCLLLPIARAQEPANASAEARLRTTARAIHDRVLTLDTHKDISPLLAPRKLPEDPATRERFRQQYDPSVDGTQQVDFPKMRRGGYDCGFFIVYTSQRQLNPAGYHGAKKAAVTKFDAIHRMCELFPDTIGLATTPEEVRSLVTAGKLVACIGIENGYPMGEDLSLIEDFHQRGARYMGIAHTGHTQLGDAHTPAEPMHGGLSELGRQAVAEMNRVGIMVDVSHSARSTMMQVLEHSDAPVIASHSGCRALCDHTRNLDDEQLLALKENGGVIQMVGLGDFVKSSNERNVATAALRTELGLPQRRGRRARAEPQEQLSDEEFQKRLVQFQQRMKAIDARFPKANVQDFCDHIDYAVKLIGIDHVGISSDFDGGGGIVGWNNAAETFNVTLELVRRGYTEQQIAKIWSGNTLRVWSDVERVSKELRAR